MNFETTERANRVEGLLLNHYSQSQIIHICCKEWDVGEKTILKYIRIARQRWVDEENRKRPYRKASAVARLHNIGRKAKDYPPVLVQVEKLISDIEGTRAPERIEAAVASLDVEGGKVVEMLANIFGINPAELAPHEDEGEEEEEEDEDESES